MYGAFSDHFRWKSWFDSNPHDQRSRGEDMPRKASNMKLVTVYVTLKHIDALDKLVEKKFYPSRAEAIRMAIRDLILSEGSFSIGVIKYVWNRTTDLGCRLARLPVLCSRLLCRCNHSHRRT